MRADQIAEDFPVTTLESDAMEAARLLAERRLPGLIVTDNQGKPYSVLPGSQVVRFLVPRYVQDDPSLAGVIGEQFADRVAAKLSGVPVRDLLPERPHELPVVKADDTVLEIAAIMARMHSPLVAVLDGDRIVGAVTASRLLQVALSAC